MLLIELVRLHGNNPTDNAGAYRRQRFEEFSELLEAHVYTHKQVAEYAGMMSLSPYQLNAITKETQGKTCSRLITEHIILEAKRYLLATAGQVNQVAYQLGYEDASYFARFFKKHTGYSPETFRHNFS